ncbi:MAG: hypothetical protein U1F15_06125 [Burkholderiales bacterium]
MEALVAGGRVVDLILVLLVAEGALLAVVHRRTGRGPGIGALVPGLLAGAFLLLALRAALTGAAAMAIGAWLACAFAAHVADVVLRFRR